MRTSTLVLCCVLLALRAATAETLTGRVVDAHTGEPLDRVRIAISNTDLATATGADGSFELPGLAGGPYTVTVTAVGYGLWKRSGVTTGTRLDVALQAEGATRTDTLSVAAGAFDASEHRAPAEKTLTKHELQALAMVILADPLRTVQALPGVASNNDLRAEFAVRGAGYDRVALLVDGALADNFVHAANLAIGGASASEKFSLATINADTVSEAALLSGAFPATVGDSAAAVLSLSLREGNRVRRTTRVGLGLLGLSAVADGPFSRGRGSWLVSVRNSYVDFLQRFVERVTGARDLDRADNTLIGFTDVQTKIMYDVTRRHQAGAGMMAGRFTADERLVPAATRLERFNKLRSTNIFANAFWRYTPGARLLWTTRLFATRADADIDNRNGLVIDRNERARTGVRSDITTTRGTVQFDAGGYFRNASQRKLTIGFGRDLPQPLPPYEDFDRNTAESGGYLQATWSVEDTLSATAGVRVEHSGLAGQTLALPRFGIVYRPASAWLLKLGTGKYARLPDFLQKYGYFGADDLGAERSTHYNLTVERTLGSWARIVVEGYQRSDRGQVFALNEPRLVNAVATAVRNRYRNAGNGSARGVELSLQARSANRVTGWVSYAFGRTWYRDASRDLAFISDFDQRHTVNTFGVYRIRPTLSASAQWRYGSGFPLVGFRSGSAGFPLTTMRNTARLPVYSRLDLRLNKAFVFHRSKLTLSGEVLNVLNRRNRFATNTDLVRAHASSRYSTSLQDSIGILPALGVAWEF